MNRSVKICESISRYTNICNMHTMQNTINSHSLAVSGVNEWKLRADAHSDEIDDTSFRLLGYHELWTRNTKIRIDTQCVRKNPIIIRMGVVHKVKVHWKCELAFLSRLLACNAGSNDDLCAFNRFEPEKRCGCANWPLRRFPKLSLRLRFTLCPQNIPLHNTSVRLFQLKQHPQLENAIKYKSRVAFFFGELITDLRDGALSSQCPIFVSFHFAY